MRKTHSGFLGVLSDKDNVANNVLLGSADKGGLDNEIDDNVVETRSVLNTLIESDTTADNNGEPDDGMHPVGNPPPIGQRGVAGNGNECNEGTLRPRGDVNISVALRRASSTARAEKTKNSSNKHKERTSIAGAIVKLLEWQQPSLTNERNERSAMFTMSIMRQMESLNKLMDNCNHRERKRGKKKCAKKHAKKRKKRLALEGLDDHGGKAGGQAQSSSSSSSSSSNNSKSNSEDSDQSIAVMVVEVGGVKGAKEALTLTVNDRTLLKICYLLLLFSSLSLAPSTASSTSLS
jgi:hypothetical protein